MISYFLPSRLFRKKWIWFENPHDVRGVDMATFFSYENVTVPGFTKSAGVTSVIRLSQSLDDIWARMRKDFIRLQIERGLRHGITVVQDDNFDEFQPILEEFRRSKGLGREDYRVLRAHGTLFSAYLEGAMIAGGVFIADERRLRVWMLASRRLDEGAGGTMRQRIGEANRMILWEAIRYAKRAGMEIFDFCGLDIPEKEGGPLPPLTVYKEAFGGERRGQYYYTKAYSTALRAWLFVRKAVLWRV